MNDETFHRVLAETARLLGDTDIPYLFMGGIASTTMGRERWTHDIDVFVRPEDARRTLELLADAGFDTRIHFPEWLYKAIKREVLVDIIFRSTGDIYLDEEMLRRARVATFQDVRIPVISPEDLVVIKACVHTEAVPRHWHDGIALLARSDLDWDYLVRRALAHAPDRVLSLLCYARSEGMPVPESAIAALLEAGRGDRGSMEAGHTEPTEVA